MREGMTPVPVRRRVLRGWGPGIFVPADGSGGGWAACPLPAGVRIPRVPIGARPTPPR